MDSETLRVTLLPLFIILLGYKVYKFYRKLYKLSSPSIKEKLEEMFKK